MLDHDNPRFCDIDPYVPSNSYHVNVGLDYLPAQLYRYVHHYGLDIDPDFQRGRVWTQRQKELFMEYFLRDGRSGKDIFINCPTWVRGNCGIDNPDSWMVLVDGKQRITAAIEFMNNQVQVFGHYYREFKDKPRITHSSFNWHVNSLATREEVLHWYLQLNEGGTVHTEADLSKVHRLLETNTPYVRPPLEDLAESADLGSACFEGVRRDEEREKARDAYHRANPSPPPVAKKRKKNTT